MKRIKKSITTIIIALISISCNMGNGKKAVADYNIVPLPHEITMHEGAPFTLTGTTRIVFPEGNDKLKRNAEFLAEYIKLSTGIQTVVSTAASAKNAIILSTGIDSENKEEYRIEIDERLIRIEGATEAAVFYAIQTLRKATPVGDSHSVTFDPVVINDAPRFTYRGMMLDVARHFQPVDFIKKYIDLLALHNINRFHWHLTDDQGWRIEIDAYPKLTEIGSIRKKTVIGRNSGEYDAIPHGGFYSKKELRDIVAYAQERYITIIPEVDLPGHMLAALAAYPNLGCTGAPYEVESSWGVFDDVLCPGNDSTFIFLEAVLTEVMEIFPSEYLHIGGDESPKTRWEKCPRCQARIKELKLKDQKGHTAEHYLQSYVTARIEQFLNQHGRRIIGWDEILEGELAPNATVMSWRGMAGGVEAAQLGHDVIMTPTTYVYFDYYQTKDIREEPFAIGGYVPLEKVYSFEPVPETLTPEQKSHILGAQANLWTEYIKTPEHVEYMLLPRLAALSEVQWMQPEKKKYKQFLERLPHLLALYDRLGYNYATHVYDIQAKMSPSTERNCLDVEFSTIDNAPVYYTLDGSDPTEASLLYLNRFSINKYANLKAVAIRKEGVKSRLLNETILVSRSSYKPIELLTKPDPKYAFTGAEMLSDGLNSNTPNFSNGRWMGFQQENLVAVIDMLEPTGISSVDFNTLVSTIDWIFDASAIEIAVSADNKHFTPFLNEIINHEDKDNSNRIIPHHFSFNPVTARFFKITLKPSVIPEGHPGKGKNGFIFVDEIRLN